MNWWKWARTFRVDPESDHDETGQAEGLFNRLKIRYGRSKDISHVAVEDGQVIGAVASGWEHGGETDDRKILDYSFDLVVDPQFRRIGVGKKLIDDAIREYERDKEMYRESEDAHTRMRLWVINPALVPYLESIGFEVESQYKDGSAHLFRY